MILAALAASTIVLFAITSQCCLAALTAWRQDLKNQSTIANQRNTGDRALANRLHQTLTDLSLKQRQTTWRSLIVVRIDQESDDVRSFYLIDEDHEPLPGFLPGQHILIERPKSEHSPATSRCYSLSSDCQGGHWRISVKKNSDHEQSVSRWLHEVVAVGDSVRVRGPSGSFYMQNDSQRHIVLVSAGIGITPMLPMLTEAIRRNFRSIHFFAQYRDAAHAPFAGSLLNVAEQFPHVKLQLWISRFPKGIHRSRSSYFREGKFTSANLLESIEPSLRKNRQVDYYLCGPEEWQARISSELTDAGIASDCVRYELFGAPTLSVPTHDVSKPCTVRFAQSGTSAKFESNQSSLLGCAAKNSVNMESGCRTGACGVCAVRLLEGKVKYSREPQFQVKPNEILACVSIPDGDVIIDA